MDPSEVGQGVDGGNDPEKLNSSTVNQLLMEFFMFFGKALLVIYPVYLTGYLGLSVSWVLLCMLIVSSWKQNRKWKDARIGTAIDFLENETTCITKELKSLNMATWVNFPDIENADWFNKILQQAWPFFGMFMEKLLKDKIQASVRSSSPHLKTFTFTKVHFGHMPLKITGVKAYTHEVENRQVVLNLHISYNGDVDIEANVKPHITAGVKELQLKGTLRVILEPLTDQVPLVGAVTIFFIRRPTLKINWTGVTNLLDTPAFSHLSESAILDVIASLMVLPNRMCFPLIDQVKVDILRFPLPRGAMRVHLLEARDLMAKDTYMKGLVKGKSDPYTILRVGNRQYQSKTIKENLHPRWNEVFEFVVNEAPGQELELELFDEDPDKDDPLGKYTLDCGVVKNEKQMDQWFTLDEAENGEVHLKLQWLSLQTDPGLLKENKDGCACAMLAVYLDNASSLPKDQSEFRQPDKQRKHSKETRLTRRVADPNTFVELTIDKQIRKSKIVCASTNPVWEEGFTFFVHSVQNQKLIVQVKEQQKKTVLGTLDLPLGRLLNVSDMTLDQRFPLERSGANTHLQMKAILRILTPDIPEPKIILKPPSKPKSDQVQPNRNCSSPSDVPSQTSSLAVATSNTAPSQGQNPALLPAIDSINKSNSDYVSKRHGSFLAVDGKRASPATLKMRRFDSQSLLSENSIASSRFDLSEGASFPEAIMNHQGTFGDIELTIRYVSLRKKLTVTVNSCRNLFPCSENGSDVYVRVYLLPDQSWKQRKTTPVKKKTVNPVFDEKFEFNVSHTEAANRTLDIAVKNNRMFHTRERKEIGVVLIDLSGLDLAKGSTEWYELTLPDLKKSN